VENSGGASVTNKKKQSTASSDTAIAPFFEILYSR
jgi:hypothetical protein